MSDTIKVVPYDSATGAMTYELIMYTEDGPEMLGSIKDVELAEHIALFLEAFLDGVIAVPTEMTTVEFHDLLVKFGVFAPTSARVTVYSRMRRLGVKPSRAAGRTSYYSRRQFVNVVRDKFPTSFDEMADAISKFGRIYSVMKRSIA